VYKFSVYIVNIKLLKNLLLKGQSEKFKTGQRFIFTA
jgi:hypothetical protein